MKIENEEKFILIEVLVAYLIRAQSAIYSVQSIEEADEIRDFTYKVGNALLERIRYFADNDEMEDDDRKFFAAILAEQIEVSELYREHVPEEQQGPIDAFLARIKPVKEKIEPALIV